MISIGNIFKTNPVEFDEVRVICLQSKYNVRHILELESKEDMFKDVNESHFYRSG